MRQKNGKLVALRRRPIITSCFDVVTSCCQKNNRYIHKTTREAGEGHYLPLRGKRTTS